MSIKTGDPVILTDAEGLTEHGLEAGDRGWANSVTVVPGDKTYAFFIKRGGQTMYVMDVARLAFDEEGSTLDEHSFKVAKDEVSN